jgi:hypothetical protein
VPAARVRAPTSASAAPAPSAAPPAAAYALIHAFPARTLLFGVETAVIACEAECIVPQDKKAPAPKVYLVTKDKTEEDKSLDLEAAYKAVRPGLRRENLNAMNQPVHGVYWGRYPKDLRAVLDSPFDRSGDNMHPLGRSGKGWHYGANWDHAQYDRRTPPSLDDAVLHAPFYPGKWATWGSGGPAVITAGGEQNHVAAWDGKAWKQTDAPFREVFSSYRLTSGATVFATDKGPFLYSTKGELTRVDLPGVKLDGATFEDGAVSAWPVDGAIWFGVKGADDTKVFAPTSDAFAAAPEPPAEKPTTRRERKDTDLDEMPAPTNLSDACKTPFVVLATPPANIYGWTPTETLVALKGHFELQDDVTFVTYRRVGVQYFGAQTKTADEARRIVDLVKERKMKPQLACLDALAHTAIGAEPAKGVTLLRINVGAGFASSSVE